MIEIIKNVKIDDQYFIKEQLYYIKTQMIYVMNFFDIKEISKPTFIEIFNNKDEFRKKAFSLSKTKELPDWAVGISINGKNYDANYILELSLVEQKKIDYHKDKTIEDFMKTIIHEFVHLCHTQYTNYIYPEDVWISEGIATYLSNQYEDATYNKKLKNIFGEDIVPYKNYRVIFNYIFDNYSKEDIMKLLNNNQEIKKEIINSIYENRKVR